MQTHTRIQKPETDDTRRIGVLWSGDHLFEGTKETIEMLRSKGKQLVFVTNNSTKSRADYKKKFDSMGIPCKVVRRHVILAAEQG